MNPPNHAKQERKTVVLLAIQELKETFPLQQKIEHSDTSLQQAYTVALTHWIRHGVPPAKDYAPAPLLAALHECDALIVDEHGIGCYPFSAHDTGIQVSYAGMSVHALCAIDALAIPRLVAREARITSLCHACRCHITCSVEANGSVDGGYSEGLRVVWISKVATGVGRHGLGEEIVFFCAHCEVPRKAISFTVPEAAAIGNNLFSFQKRWLANRPSECGTASRN
jgi:hypothetical protein